MVAISECHLHTRKPTSQESARAAAEEGLAWAGQSGLSAAPVLRQLGRVALASGDLDGAEQQFNKVSSVNPLMILCCFHSFPMSQTEAHRIPFSN